MSTPAPWFTDVIVSGLQRLAAMRLPSTPYDGELKLAASVWIDSLWCRRDWHPDPDASRLRHAFTALAGYARRWPAPADLLDQLPAKSPPKALPPDPPPRPTSPPSRPASPSLHRPGPGPGRAGRPADETRPGPARAGPPGRPPEAPGRGPRCRRGQDLPLPADRVAAGEGARRPSVPRQGPRGVGSGMGSRWGR
jgi:hypothetical protein